MSVRMQKALFWIIKLHEVVYEAQKRVKYVLEKTLEVKCSQVNIFVQGVRVLK